MTYAEKLVKEYALFMFTKGDPIAVEFILNEMLQKAMQAQREACCRAYDENRSTEEFSTMMEIAISILNAEVQA